MSAELLARANTGDMDACRELYALAGAGCIDTQRATLDRMLGNAGPLNDRWRETLLEAVNLTRMVAARGTHEDRHRLASVLLCLAVEERRIGETFHADSAAFEGMGVLRDLSDEGDGVALKWLGDVAPHWPQAVAAMDGAPLVPWPDMPDVTAVPPPIIMALAPYPQPPRTRWGRLVDRWDNFVWSLRIWWWGVAERFNRRGF